MHTRKTLSLDPETWDLILSPSGGIYLTRDDLATAQDVANEARLFVYDAYFIKDEGIPHFVVELGQKLSPSVLRAYLRNAALRVEDVLEVLSVDILYFDISTRTLIGDIHLRTTQSEIQTQVLTYF